MGAKGTVPAVMCDVTPCVGRTSDGRPRYGETMTMSLEEAAEFFGTTHPTVKCWCLGKFEPPFGYRVEYHWSNYNGMTDEEWKRPMSDSGKSLLEKMRARRRMEVHGK